KLLENGEVDIHELWADDRVSSQVAIEARDGSLQAQRIRESEGVRIEPVFRGPELNVVRADAACRVRTLSRKQIRPITGAGVAGSRPIEHQLRRQRLSRHDQRSTRDLPSAEQCADCAIVKPEWKRIGCARREDMGSIMRRTPPLAPGIIRIQT